MAKKTTLAHVQFIENLVRLDDEMEPLRKELEKRKDDPAQIGDLYRLFEDDLDNEWNEFLLVSQHPRDPDLFYAVPIDLKRLVGPCDALVPDEASWGPLVLRYGFGIWLPVRYLTKRVGWIEDCYLEEGRQIIDWLVGRSAQLPNLSNRVSRDNPGYERLCDQIASDVRKVEDEIERRESLAN